MLFASSLPFLMDRLLFQLFCFLCFCSVWWVQGWYFSCHSTLISYLHGWHWKRLLKGSELSDILKSHLLFSSSHNVEGKPAFQQDHPFTAPTQVGHHFSLLLISDPSPLWWNVYQKLPGDPDRREHSQQCSEPPREKRRQPSPVKWKALLARS